MANAFHIMFKHRKDKVGSQTYCLCRNTSIWLPIIKHLVPNK
jgi:hypothetical protein